jgi:hypothetical protein
MRCIIIIVVATNGSAMNQGNKKYQKVLDMKE